MRIISKQRHNHKGNAMLITTIILLVLSIIIASFISVSGMTMDMAVFKRNTSNTYYLAQSAVEKQVDTLNKAIENKILQIIEREIAPDYIDSSTGELSATAVVYDTGNKKFVAKSSDDMIQEIKSLWPNPVMI